MPKEFPQIRINGDNDEAKRRGVEHIKRGLLELFKTQSVQQLAGVPIMKRTVQVDPYTSITVQIAKEQTFVEINSTSVPSEKYIEEVKSDLEHYSCPPAFIIRKIDWDGHGAGAEDVKGYLIGFNQATGKWHIVSFTDELGGTTPYGSNLGWWHAESGEAWTQCDVLTWHGQSGPDFSPPHSTGSVSKGTSRHTYLSYYLYFRGRKFLGPGRVCGACILTMNNIKYIYCHYVNLSEVTNFDRLTWRISSDAIARKTMSAFLADTGEWESVASFPGTTTATAWAGIASDMYHPRGVDYIDKDGYAYFIREYQHGYLGIQKWTANSPDVSDVYGATKTLKMDMRNGNYEIINGTVENLLVATISLDGANNPVILSANQGGSRWGDGGNSGIVAFVPPAKPWIFHIAPGAQALYTYALEVSGSGAMFGESKDSSSSCQYQMDIVVTKNLKQEVDRLPIHKISGSWSYTENVGVTTGGYEVLVRAVLQHHPEIKNSWRYLEVTTDASGDEYFNLHEDGTTKNLTVRSNGTNVAALGGMAHEITYPSYYLIASPGNWSAGSGGRMDAGELRTLAYPAYCTFGGGYGQNFSLAFRPLTGVSMSPWWIAMSGKGAWECGPSIGFQNDYLKYGSSGDFKLLKTEGSDRKWMAESYAVHRSTDTGRGAKKPYLWLRRPVKSCCDPAGVGVDDDLISRAEYMNRIYLADANPYEMWDQTPDPYEQTLNSNPATYNKRYEWMTWTYPTGHYESQTNKDAENNWIKPEWAHDDQWELVTNILTAKQLNRLTKDLDNAFFEIGVL